MVLARQKELSLDNDFVLFIFSPLFIFLDILNVLFWFYYLCISVKKYDEKTGIFSPIYTSIKE